MKFHYEALNQKTGKREKGVLDAPTQVSAGHTLKEQGLMPLEIHGESKKDQDIFVAIRRVKLKEKLVFIQDLSVMLKSGIPLSRSLQVLSSQQNNPAFEKVLTAIHKDVENGQTLHDSLAKHPKVFSEIFVSMVRVGELSGTLDLALEYLTIQLEREAELTSRVKGAMVYPSVVLGVMILAGIVMATYVLPKLTSIFKDFDATLPTATRIIIALSDFMSEHTILVFTGLFGLVIFFTRITKVPVVKKAIFAVALRVPGIGSIVREVSLARFSRISASLLKSGISVVETMAVTGEAMPNPFYRKACLETSEAVKLGKPMTESLSSYTHLFPFLVVQMLQVGEETGNVEAILEQLAKHYESSVDATLKNLSSIVEPLLLVVIGAAVGVVAYALIIPIYNIGSQID